MIYNLHEPTSPLIKLVEIKGFFGARDIYWELDRDLNVLVGINGSGKSTILKLINSALHDRPCDEWELGDSITIHFHNHKTLNVEFSDTLHSSPFLPKKGNSKIIAAIRDPFKSHYRVLNDKGETDKLLLDEDYVGYISTFEMKILGEKEIGECRGKVETQLDLEIAKTISQYKSFQLKLNNKLRDKFVKGDDAINFQKLQRTIFSTLSTFEKTVNSFFETSGKTMINHADGNISFEYSGEELTLAQLSSGEKQLFLILLKALICSDKPALLLLDEPEISLHMDWQEKIIDAIKIINPNCQLLIVTHSPGVIINGWMDKYIDINDISKDYQTPKEVQL